MSAVRPIIRPILRQALRSVFQVGAFDPVSLFASGDQGAWYDPSDLTTLYQDSAGTIPVTADGDPVGYMADLSGNGNHATQATGAAKPLYPGLSYDGFDDVLKGAFLSTIDAKSVGLTVTAAFALSTGVYALSLGNSADIAPLIGIRADTGNLELVDRTSANLFRATTIGPLTAEMAVYTLGVDSELNELYLRVNGSEAIRISTASGTMLLNQFAFAALARTTDDFFGEVDVPSAVIRFANSTSEQIQQSENYVAGIAGVTL